VRRAEVAALAALLAAGCTTWHVPTSTQFALVSRTQRGIERPTRLRIRLDVESSWLSGQFEGVVVAGPGPEVRLQLFPDLGGKAVDLLATPKRIIGYFPHLREGIDVRLPKEARPHPLSFLGLHLLERAAPSQAITGWRILDGSTAASATRMEIRLNSVVEGATVILVLHKHEPEVAERRLRWMYGVEWTERPDGENGYLIEAPGARFRLKILERTELEAIPTGAFELTLPPDVRKVDR